jgi:hypothetical protein
MTRTHTYTCGDEGPHLRVVGGDVAIAERRRIKELEAALQCRARETL